jgi:hypothetical protein
MKNKLRALKEFDIDEGLITLWIVRRYLSSGLAKYKPLRVETGPKLKSRMRAILKSSVAACNVLKEYEFLSVDQDDNSLLLPVTDTDFSLIRDRLEDGADNDSVQSGEDLIGAWGYVIESEHNNEYLYGFRQLSASWSAKRSLGRTIIYNNQRLEEIDASRSFKLDTDLDFLCHKENLFVQSKTAFEKGMNFRKSIESKRDEVVSDFSNYGFISNPEEVGRLCGSNMHHLRRLATVGKNAYYRDAEFLKNLKELNDSEKWGIRFEAGMIIVEEAKLPLLLTLLNNDRLRSPITRDLYDVSHKVPV